MQLKMTEWDFSNIKVVEKQYEPLSEGKHILYIDSAKYNPEDVNMRIRFRSLTTDEASTFTYNIFRDNEPNNIAIGILNSLKHSLAGPDSGDGILMDCDIVHGIVKANVKMGKPWVNKEGVTVISPQIWHFEPVSQDEYDLVKESEEVIEQYTMKG